MRKNIIIGIATAAVILSIIVVVLITTLSSSTQPSTDEPTRTEPTIPPLPTADSASIGAENEVQVLETTPNQQSSQVAIDQDIIFAFSGPITEDVISVDVSPETAFTLQVEDQQVIIQPQSPLKPSTEYVVEMSYGEPFPYTLLFLTSGPTPTALPNTYPGEMIEIQNEYMMKNTPDLFLQNQLPVTNQPFTIESEYSEREGVYRFIATGSAPEEELQLTVRQWLVSLGFTPRELDMISIEYRSDT